MPKKSKKSTFRNNGYTEKPELLKTITQRKILYGQMSSMDEMRMFTKTSRTDYGRPIDLRIPRGYHAQLQKSWEIYETDRLFRYLIDRSIDFGANGFEWELPLVIEPGASLWDKIGEWISGKGKQAYVQMIKEKRVWDTWAASINKEAANVLPGMDEINKWIIKNLLLGGMATLEWIWGKVKVDNVEYELPTQLTMYNSLSTLLRRQNVAFVEEEVWIKLQQTQKLITEANKILNIVGSYTTPIVGSPDWHRIQLLGQNDGERQGFVIKYNWSPADNTALISGKNVAIGQGLYPTPPFVGLYEQMILRRQLNAADVAIADGIINYIIDWSIGNDAKDADGNLINQPRPAKYDSSGTKIEKSTMEQVKEMITTDSRANVMQLIHPYYYKLEIKVPPMDSLINPGKYIQTIVEILMAFGIFLSPTDRRVNFTDINTANFEQMLDNIRNFHIRRFWERLCAEIVERNKGKLSVIPNMMFNPLNTQTADFRTALYNLAKIGKISSETLWQAHKIDDKTETLRIGKEIGTGIKDMMDANVPISFKQTVAGKPGAGGEEEEHSRTTTAEGGRPKEETKE